MARKGAIGKLLGRLGAVFALVLVASSVLEACSGEGRAARRRGKSGKQTEEKQDGGK